VTPDPAGDSGDVVLSQDMGNNTTIKLTGRRKHIDLPFERKFMAIKSAFAKYFFSLSFCFALPFLFLMPLSIFVLAPPSQIPSPSNS